MSEGELGKKKGDKMKQRKREKEREREKVEEDVWTCRSRIYKNVRMEGEVRLRMVE